MTGVAESMPLSFESMSRFGFASVVVDEPIPSMTPPTAKFVVLIRTL